MKKLAVMLAVVLLPAFCFGAGLITKEKAKELASHLIPRHLEKTKIEVTYHEGIEGIKDEDFLKNSLKKLDGRRFWMVYFSPTDEHVLGGDGFIFIDAITGEVITKIFGK